MMKFSREKLYNEIWEISGIQVAKKYGLNYSSLLKECKENNIPLPNAGYWYKKNNDLEFKHLIIELQDSKVKEISIKKQVIKIKVEKKVEVADLTNEKSKADNMEISNDSEPNKFSFSDEVFFTSLNCIDKEKIKKIISVLESFEASETKRLHKRVSSYKDNVDNWNKRVKAAGRSYYDQRYLRNTLEQPKFTKEVSSQQLPRLYRLMDTLFTIFEQIGEVVNDDLCIQIGEDAVSFEIIESKDKINHELTKEEAVQLVKYNDEVKRHSYASKPNIRKYDYIPNGAFRIKMSNGKYIKDTKINKLEDVIPEIVILFYQCYFEVRTHREEWEEAQRIREDERNKARLIQERKDQEKKKTRELFNILADYKLANEIRRFTEVLMEISTTDKETIQWMLKKADWIDPTISLEDELLEKREHQKSNEEKEKYLKEERFYW